MILLTVTLLAFYGSVHAALVFHGRSVVAAAAQDGLRAAQVEDGTRADAMSAAQNTLSLAPGLTNTSVVVVEDDDTVRVQVSAEVSTALINVLTTVRADASGPRERFYTEAERQ